MSPLHRSEYDRSCVIQVKHDILNLMSTWIIKEANTDKELGTIENKLRFIGSKMTANGAFGHYVIEGNFGNRSFQIKKDGEKVSD